MALSHSLISMKVFIILQVFMVTHVTGTNQHILDFGLPTFTQNETAHKGACNVSAPEVPDVLNAATEPTESHIPGFAQIGYGGVAAIIGAMLIMVPSRLDAFKRASKPTQAAQPKAEQQIQRNRPKVLKPKMGLPEWTPKPPDAASLVRAALAKRNLGKPDSGPTNGNTATKIGLKEVKKLRFGDVHVREINLETPDGDSDAECSSVVFEHTYTVSKFEYYRNYRLPRREKDDYDKKSKGRLGAADRVKLSYDFEATLQALENEKHYFYA